MKGTHMGDCFEYKWTGDWATIIDDRTTPDGSSVVAEPGEKFKSTEAIVNVPNVVPVSANAKAAQKAADDAAAVAEAEQPAPETTTDVATAESDATPTKENPS